MSAGRGFAFQWKSPKLPCSYRMRTCAYGDTDRNEAIPMTAAQKNIAPVQGDDYAEAAAGDCTPLATLINRVNGTTNAVMLVPGDFDGHVQLFELGCLRACHISCRSPMKVDGRNVIESDRSQSGLVRVIVQLSGTMTLNQLGGSSIALQPEDWCVMSHVGKFWTEAFTPVEFILLVMPGEELHSIADALVKVSDRRVRGQSGPARLFLQFLVDVIAQIPNLSAPGRISFSDAVIHVLKAAILDIANSPRSPVAHEQLYRRACEIIESNLGNDQLSIDYIAQRLHCSKRYLHLLFARHNTQHTINGYINLRRLARCRSELLMQRNSGRSIAEIAHRWGFQDPSYFARLFRREYGMAPRTFVVNAMHAQVEPDGV